MSRSKGNFRSFLQKIIVEKFIKFIEKSQYKDLYLQIVRDIYVDNLSQYDIKPLVWKKWFFRLRVWKIRFIYKKTLKWNRIVDVDNRWDIYKWL